MKLVQLNTWAMRLKRQVYALLEQEAADVVTLQEMLDADIKIGLLPTLNELQQETGYKYRHHAPAYAWNHMHTKAYYGNSILSKLPIEQANVEFVNGVYTDDFHDYESQYNIRNFQHVTLRVDGKLLHILNHHGIHVRGDKRGNDNTLAACQKIGDYIRGLDGAVILTGDFNLEPNSGSLQLLNSTLRNLPVEARLRTTRSNLTPKTEVCDYIFVNDQVIVNEFRMSDTVVSDHNALILDFTLR